MSEFNIPKLQTSEEPASAQVVIPLYLLSECNTKYTVAQIRRHGDDIIRQIKRHCDLERCSYPRVEVTTQKICRHCSYTWSPDKLGCNCCCDQHLEEWRKAILEANPGYMLDKDEENLIPKVDQND